MKILYGVVGEGMGHAMRSRVVLEHLVGQGHEVEIVASGRAVASLSEHFAGVTAIHGLHIVYEENRVRRGKTFWSNVLSGAAGIPQNVKAYFDVFDDFRPDVVISDFESWSYLYGRLHDVPVISIDNMQIINRCRIPEELYEGHRTDFEIARAFVKGKLPQCAHYLVTTFFHPEPRKDRTTLCPPILRQEILSATATTGDHLLVYQTAEGHDAFARALAATGMPCRIYGMRRDIEDDVVEGQLTYRPFSEGGFVEDLASARGVIASGGFTLMGEAVYLHKPMLAVPLSGQFEQVLNARYLERVGYGVYASNLDDPAIVHAFVERLGDCSAALAGYVQDGNAVLLGEVDAHLDRVAAGVY